MCEPKTGALLVFFRGRGGKQQLFLSSAQWIKCKHSHVVSSQWSLSSLFIHDTSTTFSIFTSGCSSLWHNDPKVVLWLVNAYWTYKRTPLMTLLPSCAASYSVSLIPSVRLCCQRAVKNKGNQNTVIPNRARKIGGVFSKCTQMIGPYWSRLRKLGSLKVSIDRANRDSTNQQSSEQKQPDQLGLDSRKRQSSGGVGIVSHRVPNKRFQYDIHECSKR